MVWSCSVLCAPVQSLRLFQKPMVWSSGPDTQLSSLMLFSQQVCLIRVELLDVSFNIMSIHIQTIFPKIVKELFYHSKWRNCLGLPLIEKCNEDIVIVFESACLSCVLRPTGGLLSCWGKPPVFVLIVMHTALLSRTYSETQEMGRENTALCLSWNLFFILTYRLAAPSFSLESVHDIWLWHTSSFAKDKVLISFWLLVSVSSILTSYYHLSNTFSFEIWWQKMPW